MASCWRLAARRWLNAVVVGPKSAEERELDDIQQREPNFMAFCSDHTRTLHHPAVVRTQRGRRLFSRKRMFCEVP
jgi:hypothetical protein